MPDKVNGQLRYQELRKWRAAVLLFTKKESNFVNMILFNKFQNVSRELIFVNQDSPEDSHAQNFSHLSKIYKT